MTRTDGDRTRARLVDVAAHAGVTKSVVSRVLNGDRTLAIRPETRERVLAAIEELNYRPSAAARAINGAGAKAIAFVTPNLTNPGMAMINRGAWETATASGYVVLIVEAAETVAAADMFAELVLAGRVDGLLLGTPQPQTGLVDLLDAHRVPFLYVNRAAAGSGRNVSLDNAATSRAAVEHLSALGHTRIAHIAGPRGVSTADERAAGFVSAMEALPSGTAGPVLHAEFSERDGAEAARRLLGQHPDVTAIYLGTLMQTLGALDTLRQLGVDVPSRMSVITADDFPVAAYLDPPLTTIELPLRELGARAASELIAQLSGGRPRDVMVDSTPVVRVRASTAAPRA
ncbi:LacI family DNA-binding transcriptional regulator [Agrococcus sp. KRD186]|uniref:LacI family DNA-binding transcriptional regulator n=1 Tax=Agrococcus sp. KRD186 TaxID=2729730 RepID=UPI001F49C4EC|nr:LacI family DNA-binding transcriptional regulator [Agrococcus sp. KRD186]